MQEFAYVYNGGTLMQMVIETTVNDGEPVTEALSFSYDASGMPMAVIYNGTAYFYTVNLQGDVMAIVDATGTAVVSYAYDAWGNILSVTGTMADTLGESNPLRYRGYVYDPETDLYYLQSRYYDPELGRFINADALVSTGQGILGNNMFAYCNNNTPSTSDPTGHASWEITTVALKDGGGAPEKTWRDHLAIINSVFQEFAIDFIGKYNETRKAYYRNSSVTAGIGFGMLGDVTFADALTLGAGLNYDVCRITYSNGSFDVVEYTSMGYDVSFFGVGGDDTQEKIRQSYLKGANDWEKYESPDQLTWGSSFYFIAGYTIHANFNLNNFIKEMDAIWWTRE